ncbi:MAG: hypothetical protein GKR94_02760 [Gammaproteobacteria bacterium]|nr:hypothetical protein [Gammaproteobacteria bacterium]
MNHPKEHKSYVDPLVDEVRDVRKALSETFDNDIKKLCDYLRRIEEQHQDRIIKPVQDLPGSD